MHRYRTLLTLIFTLLAVVLDATLAAEGVINDTLTFYSPKNENSSSTLGSNVAKLDHGSENDEYYDGDDDFLEDNDERTGEFDANGTVYSATQLNTTLSTLGQKKKSLPVKGITCSGLAAGRNVTGAVNAFVEWGEVYLVGKRNWHWAGMGGYGEYAIVWMCNCHWRKDRPVNCWELNEALRLLEDKCGAGQGGIVRLHGKREIGLGPLRKLEDVTENNPAVSLCRHRYCCYQHKGTLTQCGRRHPLNKKHLGDGCRVPENSLTHGA